MGTTRLIREFLKSLVLPDGRQNFEIGREVFDANFFLDSALAIFKYSKRPKSERSDFGILANRSVAKRFGF